MGGEVWVQGMHNNPRAETLPDPVYRSFSLWAWLGACRPNRGFSGVSVVRIAPAPMYQTVAVHP